MEFRKHVNMFNSPLTVRLIVCCWIYFSDHAAIGITTKTIPLGFVNNSDSSQYVQIRTNVNHHHHHHQGPRNPLHHPKNALSPVQQTHILDDVQKNQRIHYHPTSSFDKPLPPPPPFDPAHIKYANFLNLNSLSPPPVQTVVLSPQQTLPTTAPHIETLPYFRPITHADTKSTFPHTHSISALGQIEPLKIPAPDQPYLPDPSQPSYYQPQITSTHRPYTATPSSRFPYYSKPDPLNPYTFEVTLPSTATATATTAATSNAKTYLTKDPNSVFTPLVLRPESMRSFPTDNNKVIKEIVIRTNPEELIAKDRQKFFQQLLGEDKTLDESGQQQDDDQTVAQNDLTNARGHFEQELIRQLKESISLNASPDDLNPLLNSSNAISEFSLPDGQRVQISKDYNRLLENDDVGVDATKIKTILLKQPPTTTAAPASPSYLLEELTKGVIPPGADFEVIKRNNDGRLEEVNKLPPNLPQKKVTFVILEEQSDGSVKVQGVRGSEKEPAQESSDEVDTIIRKIKEGELKLPPSTRLSSSPSAIKPSQKPAIGDKIIKYANRFEEDSKSKRKTASPVDTAVRSSLKQRHREQEKHFVPTPVVGQSTTTETTQPEPYLTPSSTSYQYFSSPSSYYGEKYKSPVSSTASSSPNDIDSPNHIDSNEPYEVRRVTAPSSFSSFEPSTRTPPFADNAGLFHLNNSGYIANLFSALKHPPASLNFESFQFPFLPTTSGSSVVEKVKIDNRVNGTTIKFAHLEPTVAASTIVHPTSNGSVLISERPTDNVTFNVPYKAKRERITSRKTTKKPVKDVRKDNDEEESNVEETKTEETMTTASGDVANLTLSDVLKKEGFYAMAKFLKQSGLDSILNDTGPFTLFIPTDKAFRTLLIQLGGPDKAEEKFKDNPRLLSGLLLHHVIPGAFRVNTLQDEMTGVSLAGTQLRVNTYTTHDIEWNDITVVTVNGAKILDEKDIVIPQGIAHAIDRVMFPLPVGNLLQSLQADRENRYSNFLKILDESDLSYLLTGSKTFTLFAPLNRAFTHAEFTKIISSPSELKSFVLRHLVPGALYSAGMKYYQVRDSMEDGQQVTVYKEAGKIKVNTAHVITRNIPATNGVIHAIDAFL